MLALPGCDTHGAIAVLDRWRAAMPDKQTASFGVATWNGQEELAAVLGRADANLYRAKDRGRNRVVA